MVADLPRRRPSWPRLHERMDALVATFGPQHLSPDPLEVVRRYAARDDVEVVGFLGAALAFGSARGAVRSVERLLDLVTDGGRASPAAAIRAFDAARDAARLRGWRHRWLGERDAAATLHILGRVLREHGSLEAFFAAGDTAEPRDLRAPLVSFCERALALAPTGAAAAPPARLAFWFAGPARGGSAKRLCLWLRWMCRRDVLDPGPWTSVDTSRLVVPLDTHVARIGRYTGLLRRRTADWRAAVEVTENLRRFDAHDPVGSVAFPPSPTSSLQAPPLGRCGRALHPRRAPASAAVRARPQPA